MSKKKVQIQDDAIQTLIRLGLTPCQAKIYFPLSQSGSCTAKTISHISEVARPDVYRVMSQLQKIGLAQKVLTTPTKWKAIPIKEGLAILLERKKKEYSEIQKKVTTIIKNVTNKGKREFHKEEPEFAIIPRKEATKRWAKKHIEDAQKSIDGIFSTESLNIVMFNEKEKYKRALNRGAKVRFICYKSEKENKVLDIEQFFWKNPKFQIRYLTGNPPCIMTILDKKQVIINTVSNLRDPAEKPSLASTNTALTQTLQNYFERLWKKA